MPSIAALHGAISEAESTLLFAYVTDPALEPLRERACELSCDLLGVLGQLQRLLNPAPLADQRETHGVWMKRQTAGSGVVHMPKPNGRSAKLTEQRIVRSA